MGTFEGHLLPGAAFLLFGSWQEFNVLRAFFKHPGSFQSHAWFPTATTGVWRYMELIFIALGATASILMELVLTQPHFTPLDKHHVILLDAFNNLEHAAISLFFLLYALTCLLCDLLPNLPPYLPYLVGASALAQEFLLFHFHSADHMGLEGHYHMLLRIPIGIGAICAALEIAHPTSFMLSLVRAMSFQLQGGVFIQIALCIWVPSLVPLHCVRNAVTNTVTCESEVWHSRAKALATLQFTWWSAAVVVSTLIATIVASQAFQDPLEEVYAGVGREREVEIPRDVEMEDSRHLLDTPFSEEEALKGEESFQGAVKRCGWMRYSGSARSHCNPGTPGTHLNGSL